ncbi:uncharacterized protein LTR77_008855 [Saxophila tyrrhenica]|uniref:DUF3074 domain-containing protein n=1 Tax=Saxophila tyrrhenica TaxID=1690608 RepID=A0AAV9P384_9PEZI|nr:hypothetical protein LTR77_008855 [Saxophila tyrrhenica]
MATSAGLGPLIRLRNLSPSSLPSHPSLKDANDTSIISFAASALAEANIFMTGYAPANFDVKSIEKHSAPATAAVELSAKDIPASALPKDSGVPSEVTENWFARKSTHDNKAEKGTGTWEEFDFALRVDHSQHEKDYTPDVLDAHEVLNWDEQLESSGRRVEGGWEDVHAGVYEMCHKIPPPLNNRVFSVLVITGKKEKEFLVVQIPVGTQGLPGVKYRDDSKVTAGIYCSIERGELLEEGSKVVWQMATASDAKGVLPMWAQKMGVPGAVVKDVGLVVGWLDEQRGKGKV